MWASELLTPPEQRVKVAGDSEKKSYTFEAGGHTLLLQIQVDYEQNTRLIGQFITSEAEQWVDAQVKVHFPNGSVKEFRLDELNTFDEVWTHPKTFTLYIINAEGFVFHTGLIKL